MKLKKKKPVEKKPVKAKRSGKADRCYVDNKMFLAALVNRRKQIFKLLAENYTQEEFKDAAKQVRLTDDIASYFFLIAENLSTRWNFAAYTYREDMMSDGIETCLKYIDRFDPEKGNNPHAYFSKVIFWSFVRNIKKEKTQLYIRYKTFLDSEFVFDIEDGSDTIVKHDNLSEYKQTFVDNYEEYLQKKKDYAKEQKRKKQEEIDKPKATEDSLA